MVLLDLESHRIHTVESPEEFEFLLRQSLDIMSQLPVGCWLVEPLFSYRVGIEGGMEG